jgi:hypothetical protein
MSSRTSSHLAFVVLVATVCGEVHTAHAQKAEPIVVLGLRPGSRKLDGPTELRRLGEAQKLRRVANGVVRELASRPIIDDDGLRTILGIEYLVDFMDCRGAVACIARRVAKLKTLATYVVYGEYTVASRYTFRVRLLDLRTAANTREVAFSLDQTDLEDRKLWRRELEPLFAAVREATPAEPPAAPPPSEPEKPPATPPAATPPPSEAAPPTPPPGDDPAVPELEPITTTPTGPATTVETAAAGGNAPFIDSSVLDTISRGIAWHGHFQNYSAVGVRGRFRKDMVSFDDLLQLEFESDLNHVRVVGKPQLLFDVIDKTVDVRFREIYAVRDWKRVDLAVGEQITTWGVTDFYPVVDIINPRDFSRLRNWRPLDEKLPVPIVQSRALFGRLAINVLGILQMDKTAFELDPARPFALGVPVPPDGTVEQVPAETALSNAGGGVRLDVAVGSWKVSGYGLVGRDPFATVYLQTDPMTFQSRVVVDNDRVAMGAMSLVGGLGSSAILKTEAAYYHRLDDECDGMDLDLGGLPQCFYVRRVPTARANLGIESKIATGLEAHLQLISEITRSKDIPRLPAVVTEQAAPGLPEQYPWHRLATLRLRGTWARGDFTPSAFMYWSFDDEDFFVNADFEYHLADGFTFALGGFWFQGYGDKNKNRFTLAGAQAASSNVYLRATAWF